MKLCWLDIRATGALTDAVRAEAIHGRIDAIVAGDAADLAPLPPTVTKVLLAKDGRLPDDIGTADIVVVGAERAGEYEELARRHPDVHHGRYVEVTDAASLDLACHCASTGAWTVLSFRDPTKIPLEIVLAAAADAPGSVVTVVDDPADAAVVFGVLQHGSDGVMLAPRAVGDASRLKAAAEPPLPDLGLVELSVTGVRHVGMGERACVDTCTYLRPDEGILVGSHAKGMLVCASETHPLPYMPTRPFRVNAGAIMSYTLAGAGHTRYLSELRAGAEVLAVDAHGRTRLVTVGRVKIETRPLLAIDAVAADGRTVNAIVQDDWHVRVVGKGGTALNSTTLAPGDIVLGHLPTRERHVGYPIDELCYEQ
ncbi:3-dehydroquinate synthase II family protein [Phytohabitans rumicis]|uniref:3-dehydroquinate synthase II n=1 Tax=Phytohabitans rumicis TaxID=1076125 RepID=A0A6V8KV33_9ACTN|nr:3-dehydroquinate synthase II family protein [Phytohabitans rumicis]GFJ86578.1 3-dehydroquinate synthase II [Phytohabitans rumicis]